MCLREKLQIKNGFMDMDCLKKIISGMNGVLGVGISGWGEPLLNPEIIPILEYMSKKGLLVSFITNGLLLKEYARDLVNIRTLYHIGMSFDTVPLNEGGKEHDNVDALSGLEALANQKAKKGAKYPLVRVTMTVMNRNVNDMPNIVKLLAKYGAKWFDVHPALPFIAENDAYCKEPTVIAFNKALEDAVAVGKRFGIKVTYNRKDAILGKSCSEATYAPCSHPWKAPFIDFRGDVHPCCFLVDYLLGNAIETPLLSIWKNASYVHLREKLLVAPMPVCTQVGCKPKSES